MAQIEKNNWDIEEKVKVYPNIVILLFQIYDIWLENKKWMLYAQRVRHLLAETGKIYLMDKFLEYYKIGIEKSIQKRQRKFTEMEKSIYQQISQGLKSIQELKHEYGLFYKEQEIWISNNEYNEVYLLQEMIHDYRIRRKKSQSELGEILGLERETISRYENGKSTPNRRNYSFLAEKIGLPYERYFTYLSVESYELYEKIRQVEQFLFREEYFLAEELFLEIEPKLLKETAENKQYCIRIKACLDIFFERITQKENLQQLEMAMRCTFPDYNAKNSYFLKHHILNKYEAILLNSIATCYKELGEIETAIRLLQAALNSYQESKVEQEYHISSVLLIAINYTECLEKQGDYQTALKEIEKIIKKELYFGRGSNLPYLVYAKGWNILKMEGKKITEEKRNACMKCYQQAYWISGFMKHFHLQQKIEELYEENFGEQLIERIGC